MLTVFLQRSFKERTAHVLEEDKEDQEQKEHVIGWIILIFTHIQLGYISCCKIGPHEKGHPSVVHDEDVSQKSDLMWVLV